ncbi:MAG: hypothetical protein Sv326_0659 [Candidatus Fermentimicrarchaeum limneticum]|uniref:Uncharacterized protein n=1 Tax=Fermentimicrarchaeum limneticum TaxID=2795018 RepID=A0A7D5XI43_FERL1|nr:MAG: hypothetical protein Sv326_0659 [Candidatus Fermentimicrarchaeum limneticum]
MLAFYITNSESYPLVSFINVGSKKTSGDQR